MDSPELFAASNGSAKYHESAYSPNARIWQWINLSGLLRDDLLEADTDKVKEVGMPWKSLEAFQDWYSCPAPNCVHLCITDKELDRAVGMLSVTHSPKDLTATIDNLWVTPAYQAYSASQSDSPNKRCAEHALVATCHWLFKQQYRRVQVLVDDRNKIMRKLLTRCGFQMEVVLRKARVARNRNQDVASYALLNHDWAELLLQRKFRWQELLVGLEKEIEEQEQEEKGKQEKEEREKRERDWEKREREMEEENGEEKDNSLDMGYTMG